MTWARIDDDLSNHPKVIAAGNEAVGAWVRMISWSNARLTDGVIPRAVALEYARTRKVIDRLLHARLLDESGDDFAIHDFLKYSKSAQEVRAERLKISQERSTAGKRGAERRWQNGKPHGKAMANAWQTDSKPDGKDPVLPMANDGKPMAPYPVSRKALSFANANDSSPAEENKFALTPSQPLKAEKAPTKPSTRTMTPPSKDVDPNVLATRQLIAEFGEPWKAKYQPDDGKGPRVKPPDFKGLQGVVEEYGVERAREFLMRFIDDDEKFLLDKRHALRHLPSNLDRYRTVKPGISSKNGVRSVHREPGEFTVSGEVKL